MEQLLITISTALLIGFLVFPVFIKLFKKLSFLDSPGGRKIHTVNTPAMGGLPLFVSTGVSLLFWLPLSALGEIKFFLAAISIVFVIGLRDDIIDLKAYEKLVGQIVAAAIVMTLCDIRLAAFYQHLGIGEIPLWLSYALSLFTIIVITNAYNLIDGIDGLAGSVGLVATLFFGLFFFLVNQLGMALIALSLAGALMAFLNFNWAPSKIFMGDTGSLFIGFSLAVFAIFFIEYNSTIQGQDLTFDAPIGTAVAILIVPLADTLRVFIKRILRGKSPMHPDRTHTHHILLRLGCNHAQATGILVTVNIIFVLLALVLRNLSDTIVIPAIILTALALSTILDSIFRSAIEKRKEELRAENQRGKSKAKVVSFDKSAS